MVSLNDYLFSGDTVLKILHQYSADLKRSGLVTHNSVDIAHSNYLIQITELLEHNDFLTSQSQRIKDFYKYMTHEYPFLAFTFKGRIKSLIKAEEKYNGYILEYIYNYYKENGKFPSEAKIKSNLICFRDLIAYRIVISMPECHISAGENREDVELKYLYEIADTLPAFLEERGFTAELSGFPDDRYSERLKEAVRPYYRDYVSTPRSSGYKSLHKPSTTISPAATQNCSFARRIWTISRRSATLITSATSAHRRKAVLSAISFLRVSASISTKLTSG